MAAELAAALAAAATLAAVLRTGKAVEGQETGSQQLPTELRTAATSGAPQVRWNTGDFV